MITIDDSRPFNILSSPWMTKSTLLCIKKHFHRNKTIFLKQNLSIVIKLMNKNLYDFFISLSAQNITVISSLFFQVNMISIVCIVKYYVVFNFDNRLKVILRYFQFRTDQLKLRRKVFWRRNERCARVRSWIMAIMNFKQQFYLKRAFRPFLLYMQSTTSYTMGTINMGVSYNFSNLLWRSSTQ